MSIPAPGATGAPTGDTIDPNTPPATPPAPVPTPPATPPATPPTDPAAPPATDDDSPWNDPAKAEAEIKRLRRERGDERIEAKKNAADEARKDLLNTLTVALGGKPSDDAPPTVEALTTKVGEVSTERDAALVAADDANRSKAIVLAAVQAGINPARLDYVEYLLAKRDDVRAASPADPAFGATITAALAEAVAQDSSLKAPGASIGTGGPGFSGTGTVGQMTKAEFDALPYTKRAELYNSNRAEYDRLTSL